MKDFIVVVSSNRANKDGSFNNFGGQGLIRKEFDSREKARDFANSVVADVRKGKLPEGLKSTDKTAFLEITGHQPMRYGSDYLFKARISYSKNKKQK